MNRHIRLPMSLYQFILRMRSDERGATATEYSILTGFIALVIVAGVGLFGAGLNSLFGFLTTGVKAALGIP